MALQASVMGEVHKTNDADQKPCIKVGKGHVIMSGICTPCDATIVAVLSLRLLSEVPQILMRFVQCTRMHSRAREHLCHAHFHALVSPALVFRINAECQEPTTNSASKPGCACRGALCLLP